MTPAVEELRYQHTYHPVPVEQKSPALARVLNEISSGRFGEGYIYEPLLNTIRQGDYYLITEDFDSCKSHFSSLPSPILSFCLVYLFLASTLN